MISITYMNNFVGRLQVSWESRTLPMDFKNVLRESIHGVLKCSTETSNETLGYVVSNVINGRNLIYHNSYILLYVIFVFYITQDYVE